MKVLVSSLSSLVGVFTSSSGDIGVGVVHCELIEVTGDWFPTVSSVRNDRKPDSSWLASGSSS